VNQVLKTPERVRADWKISEVLKRYPSLLDVLVDASPAFGRLRNPILRRVQSRLVTVSQAAQIAGLEPADLVETLNRAIGLAPVAEPAAAVLDRSAGEEPDWDEDAPIAIELDVRAFHERGEEPFSAIMQAVARVPVGQVFRLRNTFEPVPLYNVLGKRGFVARTRQLGPDDWEILFLNAGRVSELPVVAAAKQSDQPVESPAPALAWADPHATVTIDVSELVPPEPMVKILEALEALPPGGRLLVHHVRRPMHLYPRLDALGCRHETREIEPGRVRLLIEKPGGAREHEVPT
jgi:uncharacterized protein (DUF2249 family)